MSIKTEQTKTHDGATQSFIEGFRTSGYAPVTPAPDPAPATPDPDPDPAPAPKPSTPPAPAPKPVAAADPAPAADPAAESDDKWPRTAQEWKNFRAKRDEQRTKLEARIKELEPQVAELQKKTVAAPVSESAEYKAIQTERDQLSERLRLVAVEKHPKFESYFSNKTNAQLELAKRVIGGEQGDAVAKLLSQPASDFRDTAIEQIIMGISPIKQAQMGGVLNRLEEIRAERDGEIANAKTTYEKMQAEEKSRIDQQKTGLETKITDSIKALQDPEKGNPLFQKRDGDVEWNTGVDARIEGARALLFGKATTDSVVEASFNAMAHKPLLQALQSQVTENAKLRKQIEEMRGASPTPGGSKVAPAGGDGQQSRTKPEQGMRPHEVASNWAKDMVSAMNQP